MKGIVRKKLSRSMQHLCLKYNSVTAIRASCAASSLSISMTEKIAMQSDACLTRLLELSTQLILSIKSSPRATLIVRTMEHWIISCAISWWMKMDCFISWRSRTFTPMESEKWQKIGKYQPSLQTSRSWKYLRTSPNSHAMLRSSVKTSISSVSRKF